MPGGMPYHLEKGPYLTILETQFNSDAEQLRTQANLLISGLISGQPQHSTSFYDCPAITQFGGGNSTPAKARDALRKHIFNDWFGWPGDYPNFTRQDVATTCSLPGRFPQQTGYWSGYHGDVEKIVRVTLMRAAEVALGVNHKTPPTIEKSDVRRHWPVEFFWVCGSDRFEGYLTWHCQRPTQQGQVTVVFVTPPTPDKVFDNLPPEAPTYPGKTVVPGTAPSRMTALSVLFGQALRLLTQPLQNDAMQGMWVVTHARHVRHAVQPAAPTPSGEVAIPGVLIPPRTTVAAPTSLFVGCGEVETFVPKFGDGGVEPFGVKC